MEAKGQGWLCLNRRVGETITIGTGDEAIVISVSKMWSNQVRLCILAPGVPIRRSELAPREDDT